MRTKIIKENISYTTYYKKTIFPRKKQKDILSRVAKILKPISKNKNVERILIYGSLARMELGKYDKEYHGKIFSDVDVLVISDGKLKLPSNLKKDVELPEKIAAITKKVCYRYNSTFKLENKFPIHIHIFDKNVHNKKLALKKGIPVNWPVDKKKAILIYQRKN